MSAFEGSIRTFANSAALPFLELIAGIILMLFLNWQLAAVALLVFPITLIGPRILTPKAVQANYEQKVNDFVAARHGAGEHSSASGDQGLYATPPYVRLVHACEQRRGA